MAFTPNQLLKSDPHVSLRDARHAARLFSDDQFRLAPKHKFLFHVTFSINQAALMNIDLVQRHRNEINMLVKNCDLPSFEMSLETLNQYNRKKNVQYTHKYKPITINLHDDNMGLINQLWQNYYNYYFADPSSAKDAGAYDRSATKNFSYINNLYGLDNNSTLPFFNYIKIYQMARHEFVSYTLHNPIISSWNHNKVDYAQGGTTHDNTMQIAYEAVSYDSGKIESGNPEGFGIEHYDQTPSPLSQGAELAPSASPSFANSSNFARSSSETLNNVTTSINSYQNTKELASAAPRGNITNIIGTATQGVSGLQGIAFPLTPATSTVTVAKQVNIGK